METQCTIKVRTYECDSYNHVNNANYLHYLEYARYEYLKEIGFNYDKAFNDGYGTYISRIEIDYKKPAFTDDELVIKSKPVKKGAVSGTISQQIWRVKKKHSVSCVDEQKQKDVAQEKVTNCNKNSEPLGERTCEDELIIDAKVTWVFVNSKGMPVKIPPEWDMPGLKP